LEAKKFMKQEVEFKHKMNLGYRRVEFKCGNMLFSEAKRLIMDTYMVGGMSLVKVRNARVRSKSHKLQLSDFEEVVIEHRGFTRQAVDNLNVRQTYAISMI